MWRDSFRHGQGFLEKARVWFDVLVTRNNYRIVFVAYTIIVSMIACSLMFGIQRSVGDEETTYFQTWFVAISCFSCTGLSNVDTTQWTTGALIVMMIAMEFGSVPVCSAMPSLMRVRRLRQIEIRMESERRVVRRHMNVNLAILWTNVAYWLLVQAFAFILLVGVKGGWWSAFHVCAGFNNAGFALDNRSFAFDQLADNAYVILVFIVLMPMGNTLFPIWQRMALLAWRRILAMLATWLPDEQVTKRICFFNLSAAELSEAIAELLRRPNLYYTHIFGSKQTKYLALMWVFLTIVDYLMFIPDYNTDAFVGEKNQWLQALFQTVTVRTTGFTIMQLSSVRLGHISYWILAMYLSSYPFMVSDRAARTTFSESEDEESFPQEHELHTRVSNVEPVASPSQPRRTDTNDDENEDEGAPIPHVTNSGRRVFSHLSAANATTSHSDAASSHFVPRSFRKDLKQLKSGAGSTVAKEIGWLYLCCIIIAYAEGQDISTVSADTSPFLRQLFEIASAYGTVGLSMSSVTRPTMSYSAAMSYLSQVIIIALMYFGKFRGLPQTIELDAVKHLLIRRRESVLSRVRFTQNVVYGAGPIESDILDAYRAQVETEEDGARRVDFCDEAKSSPDDNHAALPSHDANEAQQVEDPRRQHSDTLPILSKDEEASHSNVRGEEQ